MDSHWLRSQCSMLPESICAPFATMLFLFCSSSRFAVNSLCVWHIRMKCWEWILHTANGDALADGRTAANSTNANVKNGKLSLGYPVSIRFFNPQSEIGMSAFGWMGAKPKFKSNAWFAVFAYLVRQSAHLFKMTTKYIWAHIGWIQIFLCSFWVATARRKNSIVTQIQAGSSMCTSIVCFLFSYFFFAFPIWIFRTTGARLWCRCNEKWIETNIQIRVQIAHTFPFKQPSLAEWFRHVHYTSLSFVAFSLNVCICVSHANQCDCLTALWHINCKRSKSTHTIALHTRWTWRPLVFNRFWWFKMAEMQRVPIKFRFHARSTEDVSFIVWSKLWIRII